MIKDGLYKDVYIASTSPIAGIHDRACELYQQLIGITNLKKMAGLESNNNGPELVRMVYGPEHASDEHYE